MILLLFLLTDNFPDNDAGISNYSYEFRPREANAGGVLIYTNNCMPYIFKDYWTRPKYSKLESTFFKYAVFKYQIIDNNTLKEEYFNKNFYELTK